MPVSIFLHPSGELQANTCAVYFDHDVVTVALAVQVSLSYLSVASLVSLLLFLAGRTIGANGSNPAEKNLAVGRGEGLNGPSHVPGLLCAELNRLPHARNRRIELTRG